MSYAIAIIWIVAIFGMIVMWKTGRDLFVPYVAYSILIAVLFTIYSFGYAAS